MSFTTAFGLVSLYFGGATWGREDRVMLCKHVIKVWWNGWVLVGILLVLGVCLSGVCVMCVLDVARNKKLLYMEIKSLAKKIITGGSLVEALQLIGDKLLENTDQYNNYVLLISQHKDIDQKIIAGTISLSDELIVISQLRGRVVKFVDSLDENDFRVDTQESIVQDMGQSDLPIGMLLAMGRMSPTIATSRFDSWKHLLGESKDTLLAATELKNELAEKAVKKL